MNINCNSANFLVLAAMKLWSPFSWVIGTYFPTFRDNSGLGLKCPRGLDIPNLEDEYFTSPRNFGKNYLAPRRHVQNNGDHVLENLSEDSPRTNGH